MIDHAKQMATDIKQYHITMLRGCAIMTLLLFLSGGLFASHQDGLRFVLFLAEVGCLIYFLFRLISILHDMTRHLSRRMRLNPEASDTFKQAMGLLNTKQESQATILTVQLRNRVLEPWVDRVSRTCHIGRKIMLAIGLQLSLIALMVFLPIASPSLKTIYFSDFLHVMETSAPTANDTQLSNAQVNQLAHDLLALRQILEQFDAKLTLVQRQELLAKINAAWQSIKQQWQAAMSASESMDAHTALPIVDSKMLADQTWRDATIKRLSKDILHLAHRGARFDGPGMVSQGNISAPAIAAQQAEGRYHEYQPSDKAASQTDTRRLQEVPPVYRQAIGSYLSAQWQSDDQP